MKANTNYADKHCTPPRNEAKFKPSLRQVKKKGEYREELQFLRKYGCQAMDKTIYFWEILNVKLIRDAWHKSGILHETKIGSAITKM